MRYWNTVGSTGTVDESAQGLVVFDGAIARLPGLLPPLPPLPPVRDSEPRAGQALSATIRYGIPANIDASEVWVMSVRYRDPGAKSRVQVTAFEMDFPTGAITQLGSFDSNAAGTAPGSGFQIASFQLRSANFNDVSKCHYVEATLSMQSVTALPQAAKTPAIAAISLTGVVG